MTGNFVFTYRRGLSIVLFAQLPVKENVVERFEMSEIDGDLLLQLREEHLRDDLGMDNSVHRMRSFNCTLQNVVERSTLKLLLLNSNDTNYFGNAKVTDQVLRPTKILK